MPMQFFLAARLSINRLKTLNDSERHFPVLSKAFQARLRQVVFRQGLPGFQLGRFNCVMGCFPSGKHGF
jgi:hypothetical protein